MEEDTISLKGIMNFFKNKKVQTVVLILFLLVTLYLGASIRLGGLDNLKDKTTDDYTPLALDPYYFLRVAETLESNDGNLPEFDEFRYSVLDVPWTDEILPQSSVFIYQSMHLFSSDVTIAYAHVLNPVIFFVLGLIAFFFLTLVLSKKKSIAAFATLFLAILPAYLYRTMAGFSDHESIGMFGFFLAMLSFSVGVFYINREKKKESKSIVLGLISGLMTMFAIAAWGGGAKFLFMILPLGFLIDWLIKKDKAKRNYLLFYGSWVFGILLSTFLFGFSPIGVMKGYMLNLTGILTLFVLAYTFIESIIIKQNLLKEKYLKYEKLVSLGTTIIAGLIFYQVFVGNVFQLISSAFQTIIDPFGTGRVGLTVAENRKPYLTEWVAEMGSWFFYTFLLGSFVVGTKIGKGIKVKKLKYLFNTTFFLFVLGILYSRLSASSVLNGENFISKAIFFLPFLAFTITTVYTYIKSDWEIDTKWILIAAWLIPMLLAVRSAVRTFFAIAPFIAFMVPLAVYELGNFAIKIKDELFKYGSWVLVILLSVFVVVSSVGFYATVTNQAKYTGLSYNEDWQKAMEWVRENTAEGSLFVHWWDYGYWVQTGGNRPTVTDGGHQNGYWDHLIARYLLTTPDPNTAKSFMKTHNVSYLLIDPTDIGKYSAYSSIGDDEEVSDRASFLPTLLSDPDMTQTNENYTTKIYRGGYPLDADLIYEKDGEKVFLPKGKAVIYGVILQEAKGGYIQPNGVFIYNNKQYTIPIRYLASSSNYFDFKTGVNSTVYIYPRLGENQQLDLTGSLMYLSEKTMNSLVAKLYLMNDPGNEYENVKLVHEESQYPVQFYYNGYKGPIKIYKVSEDSNILAREEFLATSGGYGELDNLQFRK